MGFCRYIGVLMELVLQVLITVIVFLLGASIYSFLNVVRFRLPRKMDFIRGRSICPACKRELTGKDLVPVFSYLLLRGRCRYCGDRIPADSLLTELVGGVSAALAGYILGWNIQTAVIWLFFSILFEVALLDAQTMEIPDGFVAALALIGLAGILTGPSLPLAERLIGVFSVSVPLLLLTLLIPGAFGGGDIKMMAACGLFLGWKLSLVALFLAVVTGGFYGIYLLAAGKKGRKEHFAFGPFLCAGMFLAYFWGTPLLDWYLGLLALN